jgi:hypothetical protein
MVGFSGGCRLKTVGVVGVSDVGGCSAWRWRCPEGHVSVRRRSAGVRSVRVEPVYVCVSCGAEYDYVVDVVRDVRRYAARKPA